MHLTLTSKTIAIPLLHQFGRDRVALRISTPPCPASARSTSTAAKKCGPPLSRPAGACARKLGFDQVVLRSRPQQQRPDRNALRRRRSYSVLADGQLKNAAQFSNLIVAMLAASGASQGCGGEPRTVLKRFGLPHITTATAPSRSI